MESNIIVSYYDYNYVRDTEFRWDELTRGDVGIRNVQNRFEDPLNQLNVKDSLDKLHAVFMETRVRKRANDVDGMDI